MRPPGRGDRLHLPAHRRGKDHDWQLALARDAGGLWRQAWLLWVLEHPYRAYRAAAFALAVDGEEDAALRSLVAGWTEGTARPLDFAVDIARVRFLAGEPEGALTSLAAALRRANRLPEAARSLVAACVRARPPLWRMGLGTVLSAGSPWERLAGFTALIEARLREPRGREPTTG